MALDILLKGNGVAAEIELNPAGVVDFGYVVLGEQTERTLVATNVGDTVLQVEAHPQSKEAHVAPAQFALAPGESARLTLFFTPDALGERRGRVFVGQQRRQGPRPSTRIQGARGTRRYPLGADCRGLGLARREDPALGRRLETILPPVVQKDGTKVDVAFAIPDSLRRALIGREMVVEWTRLDENYAPERQKQYPKEEGCTIYESSGERVLAEDLNLQIVGGRQAPSAAQNHYP